MPASNSFIVASFVLLFLSPFRLHAQEVIDWKVLADVYFEKSLSSETGLLEWKPEFGKKPLSFEGKEVVISGYFIPLAEDNISLILSQNPFTTCYFCGNAGPETVLEVWLKPESFRRFSADEVICFRGILKLNRNDTARLPYQLLEAEELD